MTLEEAKARERRIDSAATLYLSKCSVLEPCTTKPEEEFLDKCRQAFAFAMAFEAARKEVGAV